MKKHTQPGADICRQSCCMRQAGCDIVRLRVQLCGRAFDEFANKAIERWGQDKSITVKWMLEETTWCCQHLMIQMAWFEMLLGLGATCNRTWERLWCCSFSNLSNPTYCVPTLCVLTLPISCLHPCIDVRRMPNARPSRANLLFCSFNLWTLQKGVTLPKNNAWALED